MTTLDNTNIFHWCRDRLEGRKLKVTKRERKNKNDKTIGAWNSETERWKGTYVLFKGESAFFQLTFILPYQPIKIYLSTFPPSKANIYLIAQVHILLGTLLQARNHGRGLVPQMFARPPQKLQVS